MNSLYSIIKSLQETQGSNAKLAILETNKDNKLLKSYLKAAYDPAINYYITKLPDVSGWKHLNDQEFHQKDIDFVLDNLANRKVTGHEAAACLGGWVSALNDEGRELMKLLIKRSIGAGVGDTMVLKVFPDLYFIPPYQRCSLMDDKIKAKFSKLPTFIVQQKLDGSFCYLIKEYGKAPEAVTRAGNRYPQWFAEKLARSLPDGSVLVGELLVCATGSGIPLSRQEGNGILNSILQGGNITDHNFKLTAWDYLTPTEFKAGKSDVPYEDRLKALQWVWNDIAETKFVKSLEEAYAIYSQYTARGLEGAIIKTTDFKWKDSTSKNCIKLKIEFEMDLRVVSMYEGTGKAKGMLGGIVVESDDGKLRSNVGSGFNDMARKAWWSQYAPNNIASYDIIVTVKANDITKNQNDDTLSLFLPIFIEERLDKKEVDTTDRCLEQLEAAKHGRV